MEIVKFLGLLALTLLIVKEAKPVQFLKKQLKIHSESNPRDLTRQIIKELLNCCMCTGFWVGFTYYYFTSGSAVLMGCLVSIAAELFARIINYLFNHSPLNKF